jgi:glutaredoxin
MKNFLALVLLVGLLAVGWANRERISDVLAKRGITSAPAETSSADEGDSPSLLPSFPTAAPSSGGPAPAPHPAQAAQAQAKALYPGLAVPNSSLNQKFVALYRDAQANNPALLAQPDWPLTLADKAMVSLGGAPMPRNNAAASGGQVRQAKNVVIYTTSHCHYCVKAKEYFAKKGIRYREIDIERSMSGEAEFKKLGGSGVPLIVVGSTTLKGFNAQKLDRLFEG